eukprot:INCI14636.1.p1 GENE.INCI14636.1~~INCI14636.1.p1  ORF type:complete len:424 (+),score=106.28 INCI14636.1:255-1526(+)
MANKVRGEYELDELAIELINKLNHLRGAHLKLAPFDEELKSQLAEGEFAALWTNVVDAAGVIFKGENKEVVDTFNIIFELLDTIDKDTQQDLSRTLANKVVATVADREGSHAETRLIVLGNLYNAAFIADADFLELRFSVLRSLVKYAAAQGKLSAVAAFLHSTTDIFALLEKASTAVRRETLSTIYDALEVSGEAKALEQTYLIKYLATFNDESEHAAIDSGVQSLACTAIAASIGNVLAANGRQLLNLAAVKSLNSAGGSKAQLFALLEIFNDGLLPDYLKFQAENPAVLKEFSINHEQALRSMRLLSLCTACSSDTSSQGTLTYANAAKAMGLEASSEDELAGQVEDWVMQAIKAGLVDAKMCQQTRKLIVYSSTQRNFQAQQWKEMAKKIGRWKTQINKLLVSVKNIRLTQQGRAQALR